MIFCSCVKYRHEEHNNLSNTNNTFCSDSFLLIRDQCLRRNQAKKMKRTQLPVFVSPIRTFRWRRRKRRRNWKILIRKKLDKWSAWEWVSIVESKLTILCFRIRILIYPSMCLAMLLIQLSTICRSLRRSQHQNTARKVMKRRSKMTIFSMITTVECTQHRRRTILIWLPWASKQSSQSNPDIPIYRPCSQHRQQVAMKHRCRHHHREHWKQRAAPHTHRKTMMMHRRNSVAPKPSRPISFSRVKHRLSNAQPTWLNSKAQTVFRLPIISVIILARHQTEVSTIVGCICSTFLFWNLKEIPRNSRPEDKSQNSKIWREKMCILRNWIEFFWVAVHVQNDVEFW